MYFYDDCKFSCLINLDGRDIIIYPCPSVGDKVVAVNDACDYEFRCLEHDSKANDFKYNNCVVLFYEGDYDSETYPLEKACHKFIELLVERWGQRLVTKSEIVSCLIEQIQKEIQ